MGKRVKLTIARVVLRRYRFLRHQGYKPRSAIICALVAVDGIPPQRFQVELEKLGRHWRAIDGLAG